VGCWHRVWSMQIISSAARTNIIFSKSCGKQMILLYIIPSEGFVFNFLIISLHLSCLCRGLFYFCLHIINEIQEIYRLEYLMINSQLLKNEKKNEKKCTKYSMRVRATHTHRQIARTRHTHAHAQTDSTYYNIRLSSRVQGMQDNVTLN